MSTLNHQIGLSLRANSIHLVIGFIRRLILRRENGENKDILLILATFLISIFILTLLIHLLLVLY